MDGGRTQHSGSLPENSFGTSGQNLHKTDIEVSRPFQSSFAILTLFHQFCQ